MGVVQRPIVGLTTTQLMNSTTLGIYAKNMAFVAKQEISAALHSGLAYRAIVPIRLALARSKGCRMKTWEGCALMVVAIFVGSALFSGLDTIVYKVKGLQPNMAPEMFIIFSPVLALPIALGAVLLHAIFAKFFGFSRWSQWCWAGIAYASVLLGLISPWLLLIPLILNPLTLRLVKGASAIEDVPR